MSASPWIDVSVPLRTGLAHWPGDPASRVCRVKDLDRDDVCTVSSLECCVHAGTHMDAPAHFIPGGATIDRLPLEVVIGPARVIEIEDTDSITAAALRQQRIRPRERILFKTANSSRCWQSPHFVEHFVDIAQDAADYLVARRVLLIGVDYLSVADYHADGVAIHRTLLGAGIWLIEGLNLSAVDAGPVQLVCLPVNIAGAEGALARALVRPVRRRQGGGAR